MIYCRDGGGFVFIWFLVVKKAKLAAFRAKIAEYKLDVPDTNPPGKGFQECSLDWWVQVQAGGAVLRKPAPPGCLHAVRIPDSNRRAPGVDGSVPHSPAACFNHPV
jgi:hypothetical protein